MGLGWVGLGHGLFRWCIDHASRALTFLTRLVRTDLKVRSWTRSHGGLGRKGHLLASRFCLRQRTSSAFSWRALAGSLNTCGAKRVFGEQAVLIANRRPATRH